MFNFLSVLYLVKLAAKISSLGLKPQLRQPLVSG